MSDFVNDFWSVYIVVLTVAGLIFCVGLLMAMSTKRKPAGAKPELHGHVWDEDLAEYNNPLPRWWIGLFYLTIVFAVGYLVLYPGLGSFCRRVELDVDQSVSGRDAACRKSLRADLQPISGARACSRRGGSRSACNRTAFVSDVLLAVSWLGCGRRNRISQPARQGLAVRWEPETIKASIMEGRNGVMPALDSAVGGREGATQVANYVMSLGGRPHDSIKAAFGKDKFVVCAACHGIDGKGNKTLGAPNLTDDIWLYGGSQDAIVETILNGRKGQMPAHKDFLGEAKVHVLAAYIYSLSVEPGVAPSQKAYGDPQKSPEKK